MMRSGLRSSASTSKSARTRRPSASVLPISVVRPLRAVKTSPGRKALPAMLFSAQPSSTRSSTRRPAAMIISARPRAWAAPPMSFFIVSIPAGGLISRPPVSNVTPFPRITTAGNFASPADRHVISTTRGSKPLAAARPTAWIIGYPGLSKSASPTHDLTSAPYADPSARAAASRSAGPMSWAGVEMRSLTRYVARAAAETVSRAGPGGKGQTSVALSTSGASGFFL
mmetsp:Transcript_18607/g.62822  ORF Transcript_18607/g.62822 Transcript_18607/m.62822 type:complete len:227 (-) Transcript_18607:450-1130(-)